MASRSQGPRQGERREASCSTSSTTEDTSEGPVEGWAPRSSFASFGAGAVQCQICSGGSFEDSEGGAESPKQVHPQQRVAEATARVERLEAALKLLGEDDPDAEPLKIALKRAKSQAQVRPVGERLDLCLQYISRVKRQVARAEEHVREAKEAQVQMEEKLANGLRDLEALRAEASEEPRQRPQQGVAQPVMEVEPNEEIVRLRALVAELQKERVQEVEANRTKKARTLAGSCTDLAHYQGGHSAQNPSEVMSTLIDAADSTLRDAGRGVQRHQGSIGE